MRLLRTSILMTLVLTVLLGVIYPFAMTGLAQVIFHDQANGSLITCAGARRDTRRDRPPHA